MRLVVALAVGAAVVALLVALAGGGETTRDAALEPRAVRDAGPDFLGIVNERLIAASPERVEQTLERQAQLNIGLLRQTFDWAQIETAPGEYDFARHDALLAATAARGVDVLPVLFNPPAFRSARPEGEERRGTYPPRRTADMAAFATAAVERYGPGGSFWAEHPELDPHPVTAWQVWNEPNLPLYWLPEPDPAAYAELLAGVARAIRRADPEAVIVTGGIPESRSGVPFDRYVDGLYRAGAKGSFDALGIHPYARAPRDVVDAVERAREQIDRHGDDAGLWITELGWASDGPPSEFTVGERGQAQRIRATLTTLARRRNELRLRGIVYFNWQDGTVYEGGQDFWGLHTGLLPLAGRPKPAYAAFARAGAEIAHMLRSRG